MAITVRSWLMEGARVWDMDTSSWVTVESLSGVYDSEKAYVRPAEGGRGKLISPNSLCLVVSCAKQT
ncbi:hypothetical protein ACLF6K_00485 [Streptomyces xanthophaeus]|uniref:hypothetical protein n=1 Tax=Streptomyces xanthophaeus TaxID=67385 RepID=UPI00398FF29F